MKLLIGLVMLPLLAQEDETVFKTGTRLVQVDVVVQAKEKNVKGLTKDDFELYDNGKLQAISVFSQRSVLPANAPPRKPPPGVAMNRPIQEGVEPVSATVILLDSQNTPIEDQGYTRQQAMKYIQNSTRRESIAVYQLDTTLKVLQPFTEDRDALYQALDKFRMVQSLNMVDTGATGNAKAAVDFISQQRRVDITTAAFQSLARHLKYIPGRKKLVWITTALPLTLTQVTSRNGVDVVDFTDMSKKILNPVQLLNDANVAMYPIDPRGPLVMLSDPNLTTMIRFADGTGGKAAYGSNDVAGLIATAIADTDVTYTLGFYPQEDKYNGAEHALRVRMKRSGLDIRYRSSYMEENTPPKLTKASREATVDAWMMEPIEATAIPIAAFATPVAKKPGYVEVQVTIDLSSLRLEHARGRFNGSIQVGIAPDTGKKTRGTRQTFDVRVPDASYARALETGFIVSNQVLANPGKKDGSMPKYMHVVVLDEATGQAGSVRVPVTIPVN